MNEISKKRKEWVKTAAIIFLSVMLVLTFFSNTIMNYSLPEVAAKYVEPGSITAKIRGNGVVESSDPYEVTIKQTRKVMSVAVREGDQVQQGDVLVYLEDTESEELKAALKTLETAQEAYDLALLAADVNAGMIQNANGNVSTKTYRQQITNAQTAVKAAQDNVDKWQEEYDDVTRELTLLQSDNKNLEDEIEDVREATEALNNAELAKMAAENEIADCTDIIARKEALIPGAEAAYNAANDNLTVSSNDADRQKVAELKSKWETLKAEKAAAEAKKAAAELKVKDAEKAIRDAKYAKQEAENDLAEETAEGDYSNEIGQLSEEQAEVRVNLEAAQADLANKEKALTELTTNISKTLNLESLQKDIDDAQEAVDEEMEKTTDAVIKAEIAGTITQINATAGKEVSAAEAVAVIQPEGKGYTMSFSVTNEQARRLSVGDKADLVNSWYYNDMDITLASIKPDKSNPGKQKTLTFDVTGDVTPGQSLNVSVGQKSANYDLIVPNSAIREDNNGKFVLIVESKSSPLGNRYVASRVDVEVIAGDDTQSAISGALYGYEFVITTSTKPVEAGQLIRLADN